MNRRIAVVVLAGVLLSGCGRTDSGAGVAARVGGEVIATRTLRGQVSRALENDEFAKSVEGRQADFQRTVLTRLINTELVEVAAKRRGITLTRDDVDARLREFETDNGGAEALARQAAQQGVAVADLHEVVRGVSLTDAVADELVAGEVVPDADLRTAYDENLAQYDQVHVAHILVAQEALAKQLLGELEGGADFAALAKQHSTDASNKDKGGDLGFNGKGAFVPEFEKAMFTAEPGGHVVGPVKTQFGFHLIKVIERKTTTFAQARDDLRREALREQRSARLAALLTELSGEIRVRVNPRFGRWDPAAQAVVASIDPLVGESATPAPEPSPTP